MGYIYIYNGAGTIIRYSKNLRGINTWCRKNTSGIHEVCVTPLRCGGAQLFVRWNDKTWTSVKFNSYSLAVKYANTRRFSSTHKLIIIPQIEVTA